MPSKSQIESIFRKATAEAQNKVMEKVFEESQLLVPVDTGVLKASGVLTKATENSLEAYIDYGSEEINYAVKVHEDLTMQHDPPTQAKFLEVPLTRHQAEIQRFAVEAMESEWRSAGFPAGGAKDAGFNISTSTKIETKSDF